MTQVGAMLVYACAQEWCVCVCVSEDLGFRVLTPLQQGFFHEGCSKGCLREQGTIGNTLS